MWVYYRNVTTNKVMNNDVSSYLKLALAITDVSNKSNHTRHI